MIVGNKKPPIKGQIMNKRLKKIMSGGVVGLSGIALISHSFEAEKHDFMVGIDKKHVHTEPYYPPDLKVSFTVVTTVTSSTTTTTTTV